MGVDGSNTEAEGDGHELRDRPARPLPRHGGRDHHRAGRRLGHDGRASPPGRRQQGPRLPLLRQPRRPAHGAVRPRDGDPRPAHQRRGATAGSVRRRPARHRLRLDRRHRRAGRLLGSLQQSKLIEGPVEQRRIERQDGHRQVLRPPHHQASTTSIATTPCSSPATLVAGSEGAMRIWLGRGWSRDKIADRYVRLCLGAIRCDLALDASSPAPRWTPGRRRGPATATCSAVERSPSRPPDRAAPGHRSRRVLDRYETDVVLTDGGTVHVRPIRADDAERLVTFFNGLSRETVYYRFFSPKRRCRPTRSATSPSLDYVDRFALVALLDHELVGVARYDRLDPGDAPRWRSSSTTASRVAARHACCSSTWPRPATTRRIVRFTAERPARQRPDAPGVPRHGLEGQRRFEDGVIQVEFPIAHTADTFAVMDARERWAEARSIERILAPDSVAVIGASDRPARSATRSSPTSRPAGSPAPCTR